MPSAREAMTDSRRFASDAGRIERDGGRARLRGGVVRPWTSRSRRGRQVIADEGWWRAGRLRRGRGRCGLRRRQQRRRWRDRRRGGSVERPGGSQAPALKVQPPWTATRTCSIPTARADPDKGRHAGEADDDHAEQAATMRGQSRAAWEHRRRWRRGVRGGLEARRGRRPRVRKIARQAAHGLGAGQYVLS